MTKEEIKIRNLYYQKKYRNKHRVRIRERARIWARNNRHNSWDKRNPEKVRIIKRRYKYSNPDIMLRENLRARLVIALKYQSVKKRDRTMKLIGCSLDYFKKHISKKFKEGMTWENWGIKTWHIDHIIPLSKFNLSDSKQQKVAFNYTNMQPLWAKENLSKGNKIYV